MGTVLSKFKLDEIKERVTWSGHIMNDPEVTKDGRCHDNRDELMLASDTEHVERRIEEVQVRELPPEEDRLKEEIMTTVIGQRESLIEPPKMDRVNKGKLEGVISDVNRVLGVIGMASIENTNDIIVAGALVVTQRRAL